MNNTLEETIESLIDENGLHAVIDALFTVCHAKAEHVAQNWQDRSLSLAWSRMGNQLSKLSAKAEINNL